MKIQSAGSSEIFDIYMDVMNKSIQKQAGKGDVAEGVGKGVKEVVEDSTL